MAESDPFLDFLEASEQQPPLSDDEKQALRDRLVFDMNLDVATDHAACTGEETWISAPHALAELHSISDDPKAALLDFLGSRPNSLRAHIRARAKVIESFKKRDGSPHTAVTRSLAIIPPTFWNKWDSGEEEGFTDDSWNISVFFAQARAEDLTISLRCIGVELCEQDIRAVFDLPSDEAVEIAETKRDGPTRGRKPNMEQWAKTVAAIVKTERDGEFRTGVDRPSNLAAILLANGSAFTEAYLNTLINLVDEKLTQRAKRK